MSSGKPSYRPHALEYNREKMFVFILIICVLGELQTTVACPDKCDCFSTGHKAGEVWCTKLSAFPSIDKIPSNTTYLDIKYSTFSEIPTEDLYRLEDLRTLSITHSGVKTIGTFKDQGRSKLTTIMLNDNEITSIENGAFDYLGELVQISLDNNRLESFPRFNRPTLLKKLHLNGNNIKSLNQYLLRNLANLRYLELENTKVTELPAYTFKSNRELLSLSLKYSSLENIEEDAFTDSNLQELLLDETKITKLPARGLDKLKILSLKGVKEFWAIPAGLKRISEVHVSEYNSFLCCAFVLKKYQRDVGRQDNSGYVTSAYSTSAYSPSMTSRSIDMRSSRTPSTTERALSTTFTTLASTAAHNASHNATATTPAATTPFDHWGKRKRRDFLPGTTAASSNGSASSTPGRQTASFTLDPGGGFVPGGSTAAVPKTHTHLNKTNDSLVTEPPPQDVICSPGPDAYHPCEDIMGAKWLTVVSLMVGSVALVANLVVVIVVLSSERRFNVNRFLMSNLAFADFCLGLYLFIVVCVSLDTSGEYYNHVRSWQHGVGCQIAGFLAVFSTELSVYALTVITIERFLAIVYAMQVNTRLSLRTASKAMIAGWVLAMFLAALPLIGVNSYQDVAICLPFNSDTTGALAYVGMILVLNLGAFIAIAALYAKMFLVVVGNGPLVGAPQRNDAKVAKRMSLLVFTDFVCWMPIAFFGLVAALGQPLIGVEESKFLLVFFFPLNSFCNPFLYAFFTKAFKREFFSLLSRFGFCHTRALHYKGTLSSLIYSRSRTKRSTMAEDDRDTKLKRISTTSATELKSGNSFLNVNGEQTPSPVSPVGNENIPMTGLLNPGFTSESAASTNNDQVFFGPSSGATKAESPKSALRRPPSENGAVNSLNPDSPQIPRAVSTSSINGIDGLGAEKRAKKQSVSFRDEPRVERGEKPALG